MPRYRALKQGFFGGELYDPNGKRPVLHTEKPFPKKGNKEQVPSWLEPMKEESKAQKTKRQAAEKKAADAAAEKAAQDKIDTDAVTFTEAPKSTVETLG